MYDREKTEETLLVLQNDKVFQWMIKFRINKRNRTNRLFGFSAYNQLNS